MEEWRDITGYEGTYQVSSLGRVKSLGNGKYKKEKILKPGKRRGGYLSIHLNANGHNKNVSIHKLVALAFPEICGEWFPDAVCHHINENRTDNRPENIRWVTNKFNSNTGTGNRRRSQKMKNHTGISKKINQYDREGNLIAVYPSMREAERQTGICASRIGACARKQKWASTAGGFKWEFVKK